MTSGLISLTPHTKTSHPLILSIPRMLEDTTMGHVMWGGGAGGPSSGLYGITWQSRDIWGRKVAGTKSFGLGFWGLGDLLKYPGSAPQPLTQSPEP